MAKLASGSYVTRESREVVVWPSPDHNGDGEEVFRDALDPVTGAVVDSVRAVDQFDREIFQYNPPAGFANKPGYDHTDNWVKVSDRGAILRDKDGAAIGIKPGQALVFHPDGSVEVLIGDRAMAVFAQLHERVDAEAPAEVPSEVLEG